MNTWTTDELAKIGDAEELHIAPQKQDGSLRDAVTIWVVRSGNEIYVRSVNGVDGKWYQHALEQHKGHIEAGGVSKNVTFSEVNNENINEIDTAYQTKYVNSPYVNSTLTLQAKIATLKLIPL